MCTSLASFVAAAVAYLLGSVPFGYIAGRLRGVDIRTVGSGNIGATNVFRTLGKGPGATVFLLDAAKGAVAVAALPALAAAASNLSWHAAPNAWVRIACAIFVLLGHTFPVFLNFKGGKGVATGLGVAFGLVPHSAALGLSVWVVLFLATRYVSVASIVAALIVAAAPWVIDAPAAGSGTTADYAILAAVSALGILVALKHRSNVRRLLSGTENRFCFTARQLAERQARLDRQASDANPSSPSGKALM